MTTEKTIAAVNATIDAETKPKRKPAPKAKPTQKTKAAPKTPAVFTTVELAKELGMNPKTLRYRMRRNIEKWTPLFADGKRHVFKNNKTIRNKAYALLA